VVGSRDCAAVSRIFDASITSGLERPMKRGSINVVAKAIIFANVCARKRFTLLSIFFCRSAMPFILLFIYALCASTLLAFPHRAAPIESVKSYDLRGRGHPRQGRSTIEQRDEKYYKNWAGAAVIGEGFTTVSGTLQIAAPSIPIPSIYPNGSQMPTESGYSYAAFVGLGGIDSNSLFQAGVMAVVNATATEYLAWWEWYPTTPTYLDNFEVSTGDAISVDITATGPNTGTVTFTNQNTGQNLTQNCQGSLAVNETTAEWIVEDPALLSSTGQITYWPFADFGTLLIKDCLASTGLKAVIPGDYTFDMSSYLNKTIKAHTTVTGKTIAVQYVR
jgi:hypothetical protein